MPAAGGSRAWGQEMERAGHWCPEGIFADPLGLSCPMSIRAQGQCLGSFSGINGIGEKMGSM